MVREMREGFVIATVACELWLVQAPDGAWELTRPWVTFQDGTGACGLVNAPLKRIPKGTCIEIEVQDVA